MEAVLPTTRACQTHVTLKSWFAAPLLNTREQSDESVMSSMVRWAQDRESVTDRSWPSRHGYCLACKSPSKLDF